MTAAERLCELIRIPTISAYDPKDEDSNAFEEFTRKLTELYPYLHQHLERELIGDRGIVYRWKGRRSDLKPILLLAHYDVVPPGDQALWDRSPFSGDIADGRIHGRGSLDDKGMLAAWMEAVERVLAAGERPERSVYLAFGGDEESSGERGAGRIAAAFAERGEEFALVFDEGGAVALDQLEAFTPRPVALLGIAEKGYLTLRISAEGMAGHSSAPPKYSAIGRLSKALAVIEDRQYKPRMTPTLAGMLKSLGSAAGGIQGLLMSYPRIFGSLLLRILNSRPGTVGLAKTTTALTVVRAGDKNNVLPSTAEAMVNLRLLPGDSVDKVLRRVKKLVAKKVDDGISVEAVDTEAVEPVPEKGRQGSWWKLIERLVEESWEDVVVAPYLMTGTTDSRHFRDMAQAIIRFIPMAVRAADTDRVHAPNESISVIEWEKMVDFMVKFIQTATKEIQ